jgi:hypothetical protein
MESHLDRVAPWRKAYRELPPGLTTLELALLMTIERRGMRDAQRLVAGQARPDVGWSVRDDGQPDSRRELAAIVGLGPTGAAKLNAAIDGLVALRRIVVADDGALGMVGWSEGQEPPTSATPVPRTRGRSSTERVRAHRERERERRRNTGETDETPPSNGETAEGTGRGTPGNVAETLGETAHGGDMGGQKAEDRGQKTELAGCAPRAGATTLGQRLRVARESGAVPMGVGTLAKGLGLDVAVVRAFEADEQLPTRYELRAIASVLRNPEIAELELPSERDPSVVVFVVNLHRKFELEFEIVGPDHPQPRIDGEVARWVFTPGGTAEEILAGWRLVLERAAEKIRRELERGRGGDSAGWFTLSHLSKPKIWREYLDKHDLDHRRSCSPNTSARGRVRGPAPPRNAGGLKSEVPRG